MSQQEFEAAIKEAASFFSSLEDKDVLVITHIDCDGLSAAAIIARVCDHLKRQYTLKRIRELNEDELAQIKSHTQQTVIFVDIGSSQKTQIDKVLKEKNVFIIDHHYLEETKDSIKLKELNPKAFGVNERRTISSSGVAYLFAKNIMDAKKLLPLALVGAIGDAQEENGFIGYNEEFLKEAEQLQLIQKKKTLRLFGRQTRPVLKAIQYSVDIPMQGITNNRDGCLKILRELHIPANRNGKRVTLDSLTKEEEEMLNDELLQKMDEEVKARAWWNEYTLLNRPTGSQTRNLREFSTLLNACGRLDDAQLGVDICLGKQGAEEQAKERRNEYRQTINDSKQWVKDHPENIIQRERLIIINGEDHIPPDIAGTIASIYAKSGYYQNDSVVCVISDTKENTIKISLRTKAEDVNLKDILQTIIDDLEGSCGGHKNAAGAITDIENKDEFITQLKEAF